ncbi:hypothetical protein GOODEAATRI_026523 [Goodea atripinnis]|uniref:Uncharacterized protein n=1 Tax=Goodea atripinnis TaxID=208336 RepID=A0ABV0MNZ1_9TELE
MTRHCDHGLLALGLNASSGGTIREAMPGSTGAMRLKPNLEASCRAASALSSTIGREKALVSGKSSQKSIPKATNERASPSQIEAPPCIGREAMATIFLERLKEGFDLG